MDESTVIRFATIAAATVGARPGEGALLDSAVKPAVVNAMKQFDASYSDGMVTIHYRSEPASGEPHQRLPRPAALLVRATKRA